jgi:hypothetical protein
MSKSENQDRFEQLRTLKSLLDEGILTQEEFDAKKTQILSGGVQTHAAPSAPAGTVVPAQIIQAQKDKLILELHDRSAPIRRSGAPSASMQGMC